jgi:hypothetical protein
MGRLNTNSKATSKKEEGRRRENTTPPREPSPN